MTDLAQGAKAGSRWFESSCSVERATVGGRTYLFSYEGERGAGSASWELGERSGGAEDGPIIIRRFSDEASSMEG